MTNKLAASSFHHIEFYAGDATSTYRRFMHAVGLELVSKSDFSTGNTYFNSYLLQSGQVRMLFTAPYDAEREMLADGDTERIPFPYYNPGEAARFFIKHGLSVRAIGIVVANVSHAFETMVANGASPGLGPHKVIDQRGRGWCEMAEIKLYGDVVVRLVGEDHFEGAFLPNFEDIRPSTEDGHGGAGVGRYGIERFDHIVGNVWSLPQTLSYMRNITGFHEFAEFTAQDVGTVDSGLNSVVLANNEETILLPINEPTYGTKRKSQIQTYLEQNKGEGVQHIALFTNDIFHTLRSMRAATASGGFDFMASQPSSYYSRKRGLIGDAMSEAQYQLSEQMGVLIDKDDQGVLLQIFTQPIGDRPTAFFEIIQRVGCINPSTGLQKPGCGGFGKGNFRDLFQKIEDYENSLNINSLSSS